MFRFHKLDIYRLAKELVILNYQITEKFPLEERYGLTQQMNRSAISIPSNIAEGTSRNSNKDKIHFINLAYSSLMENVCQMEIALDLSYLSIDAHKNYEQQANHLAVKLTNFKASLERSSF